MAQNTMYPGIDNSPKTTLTDAITASESTISVLNASVLPTAPNLATIGTGDSAEVILYSGITDNSLTGCIRGVGGMARMWSAGANVYRAYTNKDHQTFIDNIGDLYSNKLAKTGDGSNVMTAFTAAASKENITTGDKLSVIFGKLAKWFTSFGSAAWLSVGTTGGTVAAGLHAAQHASNGADPVTPASIGAAALSHKSRHATGGGDALTPVDIGALSTTGDGSNVTVTASAAASRANITTGDKLSVIVGKIMKWFTSFGSAAWLSVGTTGGTVAAGLHAAQHASNGADAITPANIGAAPAAHNQAIDTITGLTVALATKADKPTIVAATLTTTWTGTTAPYTQMVNIAGITASDTPIADVALSDVLASATAQLEAWACVSKIETGNGSITVTCYTSMPTVAIPIILKVVR